MARSPRTSRLLVLVAAVVAGVAVSCGTDPFAEVPDLLSRPKIHRAPPRRELDQPIQHVFIVLMENHTYDNYFAAFPNPTGDPPTTVGTGAYGAPIPLREPSDGDWSPGDNSWGVAHRD